MKNKKYALCFFGYPPMQCNKHIKVEKDFSFKCWNKNVLSLNNVDVFIHSWGKEDKEDLAEKYKPQKIKLQDNIIFDTEDPRTYDYPNCTATNMFYSQAYSAKESILLKRAYEKENNITYDLVMMSRIDCLWLQPLNLNNISPEYFYVSNWNQSRQGKDKNGLCEKSNVTTKERNYRKILDYWFIANSENIDTFGNLFDYVSEWVEENKDMKKGYKMSNHTLKKDYLVKTGLWKNVKFKFHEHHDHNIQRYFYQFKDHKRKNFKWIYE